MLIEQRRKDGEPVATINCKEFLGNDWNTMCIFDAEKDTVKRTERCPSVGDEMRCYIKRKHRKEE